MKTVNDIKNLKGKRIILRADFNVPIENGLITDDFRIKKTIPTLKYLQKHGAKTVIVSHIESDENTLSPVFEYLRKIFSVKFVYDIYDNSAKNIFENLKDGEFVLLENIRRYEGEKKNDPVFAKDLSAFGDVYINEAFSASHRPHASIVGVPKFIPGYAGFLFEEEVKNLSKAFKPKHPFLFILGGLKFETKLPLVEKFLKTADEVFVVGALANDILKARGFEVGKSSVSEKPVDLSAILNNPKLKTISDAIVGDRKIKDLKDISKEDKICDVGPKTLAVLKESIKKSKFILWNGPLGIFEEGFKQPTLDLAKAISESGAESVVGGGDTLAAIEELNIGDKFSFISTGGGAMLDFLADETLPGIEALEIKF